MLKLTLNLEDLVVDTNPLGPLAPDDPLLLRRPTTGMNTNEPGCTLPELCGGG